MGTKLWNKLRCMKWHQWARVVALAMLIDQWIGPLGGIPESEAIVVVCLGALFAPVPSSKKDED